MGIVSVTDITDGTTADADDVNSRVNAIVEQVNGSLDANNIATGGVGAAQLSADAVTNAKIDDGAVDTDQLADDAVTEAKLSQDDWIAPTLQNSWVDYDGGTNYEVAGYMKDAQGFVHLRGMVKNGSSGSATIFTLPAGYRPLLRHILTTSTYNSVYCRLNVNDVGEVTPTGAATNWVSLSGLYFKAEQ